MKNFIAIALSAFVCQSALCQKEAEDWIALFNGKDLTGWDTYIGPIFDSVTNKRSGGAPGENNDKFQVFSVAQLDGAPALRVSGEQFGGISTTRAFGNYHLRLEFRWGQKKWAPKKNDKKDSGILYHAVGRHGADGGFWMRSQEFQIQAGDCGDYWGCAGGSFAITAKKNSRGEFVYDPMQPLQVFNEKSPNGRRCIKQVDTEYPDGSWNTVDIYTYGGTAVHILNGRILMLLQHSSQLDGDKLRPLEQGKIQIQSEGAEVYYRNIRIRPIDAIPQNILDGFTE